MRTKWQAKTGSNYNRNLIPFLTYLKAVILVMKAYTDGEGSDRYV
ncbi:hypothetical protein [Lactiplantibacillus xiangfangensis]